MRIGEYEFIQEPYVLIRFRKALKILEKNFGLIELSGPEFEGDESSTEWKVIDYPRLDEYVKKKSINNILKQIY